MANVARRYSRPQAAPPRPAIVKHSGDYPQHEDAAKEGQDDHGSPSYVPVIVSPASGHAQASFPARDGDRYRRSCRGWYQADRHPGAWQCTTR
jgi:hypothetical protein